MSVEVVTFGCRLNAAESEVIRPRGRARRACRYHRRQYLRGHGGGGAPGAAVDPPRCSANGRRRKIVVTGCAAQTEPQTFAAMTEVDRVVGNTDKLSATRLDASAPLSR